MFEQCPFCGSINIIEEDLYWDDLLCNDNFYEYYCEDCGASWDDNYYE